MVGVGKKIADVLLFFFFFYSRRYYRCNYRVASGGHCHNGCPEFPYDYHTENLFVANQLLASFLPATDDDYLSQQHRKFC